jgi:Cu(I)/Ag(I) efflux system membrane fusion protein
MKSSLTALASLALVFLISGETTVLPILPLVLAEQTDGQAEKPKGRILYYRNPMGLPDISPVPKKDSMGMDYLPVYEGEEPAGNEVKISLEKVQKLGVKSEAASVRSLTRPLRAVGTIGVNERRLYIVAPRFEGWIEHLYVNATGLPVKRGQALMDVYSPELVSAQQEYLISLSGERALREGSEEVRAGIRQLAEATLQRLRNWGIPEDQIQRLRREGKVRQLLTLRAPIDGVVMEKTAIEGMRFMPGEVLYRIADLSTLWVMAAVFEQDLGLVHTGQPVVITVNAYPGQVFEGRVSFVYPTVNPQTRTAQVRIELPNPRGLLKPAMYASLELAVAHDTAPVVTVPTSAVIYSGTRQVVLLERGEGRYEPRPVKLGLQADNYVQVLEGVSEGEKVVVSANFLIDAESNLRAALGSFGHAGHGSAAPTTPESPPSGADHTGHGNPPTTPAGPSAVTPQPLGKVHQHGEH